MNRKQNIFLFFTIALLSSSFVIWQFQSQKLKHERLETSGVWTPLMVEYYDAYGSHCVRYTFTTGDGQVIEGGTKCGSDCSEYSTALAVYNPVKTEEYELSIDFYRYNPRWRKIFFFLIYLPIMSFVNYGAVRFIFMFYRLAKKRFFTT